MHRIVATRNVFGKAELRQQRGSRQRSGGLRIQIASARNRRLWALPQSLIDGLPQRKRFLRSGGQSPHREQEKKAQNWKRAEIHEVKRPWLVHSLE